MTKKKTNEEFIRQIYDIVQDEYKALEEYKNSGTKIKMRHEVCGYEYKVTPHHFISSGSRCPNCFGSLKKTTEQFKKEIYDLVKNEYSVMGEYRNTNTKIKMKHNKCGCEYEVTPNNFLSAGNRCYGKFKKTTEQFKKEVYDSVGDEYTVLGEYKNKSFKIKMKHNKCGYEYGVTPDAFLNNNNRCPNCFKNFKKTTEQFKDEVYNLVGNEYIVLGEYKGKGVKIKMKHNECGYEYFVQPNNFLSNGTRCPNCFGSFRKTTEQFKKEVYDLFKNQYTILGEYSGASNKIKVKHNKCGYEYEVKPYAMLYSSSGCPKCKESKGEKKISEILDKYNISYIKEFAFNDCKYKNKLRFDFAVIDDFKKIIMLIEYDGRQHYQITGFTSNKNRARKEFYNAKKRDAIKNRYCIENKIPILRIPYWEFDNIEKILLAEIYKKN